jgi:hypothetical protein
MNCDSRQQTQGVALRHAHRGAPISEQLSNDEPLASSTLQQTNFILLIMSETNEYIGAIVLSTPVGLTTPKTKFALDAGLDDAGAKRFSEQLSPSLVLDADNDDFQAAGIPISDRIRLKRHARCCFAPASLLEAPPQQAETPTPQLPANGTYSHAQASMASTKRCRPLEQVVFAPPVAISDYEDQKLNNHLIAVVLLPSGVVFEDGQGELITDRYRIELLSEGETASQLCLEALCPPLITNLDTLFDIRGRHNTSDDVEAKKSLEKHFRKFRASPDKPITAKAIIDLPKPVPKQKLDHELVVDDNGAAVLYVDMIAVENRDYKSSKVKVWRKRKGSQSMLWIGHS